MKTSAKLLLSLLIPFGFLLGSAHADEALIEKGKAVYNGIGACFACHGPTGKGDGAAAAALNPKPRDFALGDFAYDTDKDGVKGSDKDLTAIIQKGAAAFGGSPLMAGRPDIPEDDVKAMVAFIRSLKKGGDAADDDAAAADGDAADDDAADDKPAAE